MSDLRPPDREPASTRHVMQEPRPVTKGTKRRLDPGADERRVHTGSGRGPSRPSARTPSKDEGSRAANAGRQAWIGIDVSKDAVRPAPRGLYPLLAVAVVAALAIAAVRIDLLRTRYAVAAVLERENELIEEQRQLIVRRRQLRDPVALAVQARERGFRPPAQVVTLPDPPMGPFEDVVRPKPVIGEAAFASASSGASTQDTPTGSEWQ